MIFDSTNTITETIFSIVRTNINLAGPTGILLFGLLTGLRHSMEADHVAAVLSMVASNQKQIKRASILGIIWGLGHTTSLFIAGFLVLLLAVNISERVSNKLEFSVGIMLILLGINTFTGRSVRRFFKGMLHPQSWSHKHIHFHEGNVVHSHDHVHEDIGHRHSHKSLVGMIHGMAGSGALLLCSTIYYSLHSSWVGIHCYLWSRFNCRNGWD